MTEDKKTKDENELNEKQLDDISGGAVFSTSYGLSNSNQESN